MTPLDPRTLSGLLDAASREHGLPRSLVAAIADAESGGDPSAFRFEPAFFTRYVDGKNKAHAGQCSLASENMARASSFGLMQVMGQTARELGFDGPFLTGLCDPATGLAYGCRLLARLAARYKSRPDAWQAVAAAYNGGPGAVRGPGDYANPAYVQNIGARLAKLGASWEVLA